MITRLPKLTDLKISEKTKEILNGYLMQQIIGKICQGTLTEIPGIDAATAEEISLALLVSVNHQSESEKNEMEISQLPAGQHLDSSESESEPAEQEKNHDEPEKLTEEEMIETQCLLQEIMFYVNHHFYISLNDDFKTPTLLKFQALQEAAQNMSYRVSMKFLYLHHGIHGEKRQKNLLACLNAIKPCDASYNTQDSARYYYNRARIDLYEEFMPRYAKMVFATPEESPIIFLGLLPAQYNALCRAGYKTVGDLLQSSEMDLLRVRHLGKGGLEKIISRLQICGYR